MIIHASLVRTILSLVFLNVLTGCATTTPELQRFEYREIVMGGEARIVLYAEQQQQALHAARSAFQRLHDLDTCMSDYRADSELMQLCATHGESVAISDDLMDVLNLSRRIHAHTGGAFDVTIGPIVRLWRSARKSGVMPDAESLRDARMRTGMSQLQLDAEARTARLTIKDMQLDLGGIGKGFAAQRACDHLIDAGFDQCLVDLGGDIVVGAAPPGRDGWPIAVDADASGGVDAELTLTHAAVATSGDAYQHVVIDGVRYSHIVDPRTGLGVSIPRAAVVIADDGAVADAFASAACICGFEASRIWCETWPGLSIRVHEPDAGGFLRWQKAP